MSATAMGCAEGRRAVCLALAVSESDPASPPFAPGTACRKLYDPWVDPKSFTSPHRTWTVASAWWGGLRAWTGPVCCSVYSSSTSAWGPPARTWPRTRQLSQGQHLQRENPGDRSEAVWAIAVNVKQCNPDSSSDNRFAFHVYHLF